MGKLHEDILEGSDWIVKAFKTESLNLDYSINSFIEIDIFFNRHSKNGKAIAGKRLNKNLGPILFSIGAYIGETIIKNIPGSKWNLDDNDPMGEITAAVELPNTTIFWPMQRAANRFRNGNEDSIYPYGFELTKDYVKGDFDNSFWEKISDNATKKWWKFW